MFSGLGLHIISVYRRSACSASREVLRVSPCSRAWSSCGSLATLLRLLRDGRHSVSAGHLWRLGGLTLDVGRATAYCRAGVSRPDERCRPPGRVARREMHLGGGLTNEVGPDGLTNCGTTTELLGVLHIINRIRFVRK